MCQGNPVLRVLGFSFLLVAFITAGIGFISPFWIRNTKADPEGMSLKDTFMTAVGGLTIKPSSQEEEELIVPTSTIPGKTTTNPIWSDADEEEEEGTQDLESRFRRQAPNLSEAGSLLLGVATSQWTLVTADDTLAPSEEDNIWFWEGLWAKCQSNLTCRCFVENDFEMEKEFHDWHKAAQGLFSLGFIVYFITILVAGFYLCCTCCRESVKLATTLGSFTLTGILLIALALIVYGGFSYLDRKIHFEGSDIVFEWGYFLAIASLGPAILAAIFYFIDGCRGTIVVEHDDCETAKMV